jgi:hypothetical protein
MTTTRHDMTFNLAAVQWRRERRRRDAFLLQFPSF